MLYVFVEGLFGVCISVPEGPRSHASHLLSPLVSRPCLAAAITASAAAGKGKGPRRPQAAGSGFVAGFPGRGIRFRSSR